MKYLIIFLFALLPFFAQAQLLRAYGVVEIGSTFPTSSTTGAKFAYRTTDSSFYRWIHTNVWVKVVEPSITPDTLYLTQISGTTAIVNGDTINLTPYVLKTDTTSILAPYIKLAGWGLLKSISTLRVDSTLLATKTFTNRFLLKSDTASMLTNYPSTVGYGIIDGGKTWRADTTSPNGLATRLFAKTLPTSIATGYIATSNGTNLVARNLFDNDAYVGILNSKPFALGQWTTAGRPTGTSGYMGWNTTLTGLDWYNGTRWATALESTFARGTSTYVPHFDANGQLAQSGRIRWNGTQTDIYGSTNAYSGATKSFRVLSLNGVEMFYVNDNGFFGNPSFVAGNNSVTIGGAAGFPIVYISSGAGTKELFQHETSGTVSFADNSYTSIPVFSASASFSSAKTMSIWGRLSIGKSAPSYDFDIASTNAYGLPRGTVAQRPTIASSTTPFRYNTDSTALEYGESVGTWRLLATRAYARSLVSAIPTSNIYTANGTLPEDRTITGANYSVNWDNITGFNLISGAATPATSITSDVYSTLKQYVDLAKNKYVQKYNTVDSRTLTVSDQPNFVDIFEWNTLGSVQYEWGNATIIDTVNSVFIYKQGGRYWPSIHNSRGDRPATGTAYRLNPVFNFHQSILGNGSDWSPLASFTAATDTVMQIKQDGQIEFGNYTSAAPFTPGTTGEDATTTFLTTSATTGKLLARSIRSTSNIKDVDLTVTDLMLESSYDIHIWAYCSNAASDSVVIDLPTPSSDYVGQIVSVYGDGRNATPNRDVYVRCVGAKLWHGNASPTGETYYQVTSLGGALNSKTAEFICVQNPDDNVYYWQLKQHP